MEEMSELHQAIESGDLRTLLDSLQTGADINEEFNGLTPLHHAIDVEIDSHNQSGKTLHVDATAILLAFGADPRRRSSEGKGVSAEHFAFTSGHWLATGLIGAWLRDHPGQGE